MIENRSLINGKLKTYKKPTSWHAIFPMFLVAFSGGYYNTQNDIDDSLIPFKDCAIPEVQKIVSQAQAIIMFLTCASTLVVAGYYGRLSDIKGRVCIIRISTLGNFIYVFCDLITAKYYDKIGILLLFFGPFIRGIMAGESVLMATVQAYIADCTTTSNRTIVFARLMASLFIGSAIGPFISSLILKNTKSIVNVFYIALFVDFINVIYTLFFMPESNELAIQPKQDNDMVKSIHFWERLNVFSALRILFKESPAHLTRFALPCMALADFLLTLVRRPPTLLYAMLKFKWTAYEGSLYYTFASMMKLLMMIAILPLLSKFFKRYYHCSSISFDIWMIRIGIGIDALCLTLSGLATHVIVFTLAGMLQSFSMLAQPSIRGLITTLVNRNQVGELLGAIAILDSLASK
ncbi:major facilitator superfamily domain-containing protein [Cokeromyces recurvatus]|uniref:major facilitator superfamily domain-containing protein n=1 Tax=Cokeromyces recurvatus TaxID=90255 RepID=UPI00221FEF3B|nr:major facilitator superfamily domain-containing protein [Cokeromyces recurvatus]KAI7906697.1 major facilitator superfamily domain-containing protein [Cokeromyces recurvatus]